MIPEAAVRLDLLPAETLDGIASNLDTRGDILALSGSNKVFASLLIPRHLQYRDIRSKLSNIQLWLRLADTDDLAANIRSLTIVQDELEVLSPDEYSGTRERLPEEFSQDYFGPNAVQTAISSQESESALISSIRHMSNLRRFAWYRTPPPQLQGDDDIWNTLRRLGTVKELDILDRGSPLAEDAVVFSDSFLRLSGFTSIKIHTSVYDDLATDPDASQLIAMLLGNSPDLESLELSLDLYRHIDTAEVSILVSKGHWPRLRTFRLSRGFHCNSADLVRFFTHHPLIEDLALDPMMPGHEWTDLKLPPEALPNLTRLQCSAAQAAALLNGPQLPSLKVITGVELHDTISIEEYFTWDADYDEDDDLTVRPSPWKELFLKGLQAHSSIKHIRLTHKSDVRELEVLASVAPQVTRLEITVNQFLSPPLDGWYALYSQFPALEVISAEHLVLLRHPYFEPNLHLNNERIQGLAMACKTLRSIEDWDKKAVIIRDGTPASEGVKWVVRTRSASDEQVVADGEDVYGPLVA